MAHNQPQILHQFVDLSAQALFNADSRAFLTLFVFDPTLVAGPFSSSHLLLQRELQAIYDRARRQHPNERDGQAAARYRDALAAEVKKVNPELLSGKNVQFANLLLEYLIYLRGLDCAKLGKMQVGDLKEWIKGLQAFFPVVHKLLETHLVQTLLPALKSLYTLYTQSSHYIDRASGDVSIRTYSNRAANALTLLTTLCGAVTDRRPGVPRRHAALTFANILIRVYIELGSQRSILRITNNLRHGVYDALQDLSIFPPEEVVTFLFYYGRYNLFTGKDYGRAYHLLQRAYDTCDPTKFVQRRRLLTYLIPAAMCVGILPSQHIFARPEAQGMQEVFGPAARAIKTGDIRLLKQTCTTHAKWLAKNQIFTIVRYRCELLVHRSLVKTLYTLFSPPTARVPQLSLRHLLHALSHLQPPSSLDPAPTLSTAESLVFSLLSRRLILGNVQRTADDSVLVLRRAGAFPPPETVLLDAEDDPFREGAGGAGRKVGGGGGGGGGVQSMAGQTVRLSGVKAIGA